ncbi:MAG: signal recognition particle protein [Mycoplasma sp.]|nr:signal recognition particle protein [Mycoplasma sp.]
MLNFLGNRLQKSMDKFKSKHTITEENISDTVREIKLALLEADVNLFVVKDFIKNIKAKVIGTQFHEALNPSQQLIKIVNEELKNTLGGTTKEMNFKKNPKIMLMVGLQGSGKTTTTAKIVNYLRKHKKVNNPLIVAADVYRPAAIDQLVTLGKSLNVDVFERGTNIKPQDIVKEAIKTKEHDFIIIDTAGRLSIDDNLMQELQDIKKIVKPEHILFVIDALSGQDIINVAKTFHEKLGLTGSVITKLDSDTRGGGALSITKLLGIPMFFIGTGEKVNNIDVFHPDRLANRILGMGDVLSLIEQAEQVFDEKETKKVTKKLFSGKFDLDDLLNQLKQVKKMGKFSKILGMIPGMQKISKDKIESAEEKLKTFEILMSSMTIKERKNPKLLKQSSRKNRIMKGSGRSAQEYNLLVNEFERMRKQMAELSKRMKSGTFDPSMLTKGIF